MSDFPAGIYHIENTATGVIGAAQTNGDIVPLAKVTDKERGLFFLKPGTDGTVAIYNLTSKGNKRPARISETDTGVVVLGPEVNESANVTHEHRWKIIQSTADPDTYAIIDPTTLAYWELPTAETTVKLYFGALDSKAPPVFWKLTFKTHPNQLTSVGARTASTGFTSGYYQITNVLYGDINTVSGDPEVSVVAAANPATWHVIIRQADLDDFPPDTGNGLTWRIYISLTDQGPQHEAPSGNATEDVKSDYPVIVSNQKIVIPVVPGSVTFDAKWWLESLNDKDSVYMIKNFDGAYWSLRGKYREGADQEPVYCKSNGDGCILWNLVYLSEDLISDDGAF